jgi:hypothetical protein
MVLILLAKSLIMLHVALRIAHCLILPATIVKKGLLWVSCAQLCTTPMHHSIGHALDDA